MLTHMNGEPVLPENPWNKLEQYGFNKTGDELLEVVLSANHQLRVSHTHIPMPYNLNGF